MCNFETFARARHVQKSERITSYSLTFRDCEWDAGNQGSQGYSNTQKYPGYSILFCRNSDHTMVQKLFAALKNLVSPRATPKVKGWVRKFRVFLRVNRQ